MKFNKHFSTAVMWIAVAVAVIAGLVTTKDPKCIAGLFAPVVLIMMERFFDLF